jgi:ubiquinone/menaquinone biosynthesis C-methylase UbiE
MRPGTLALLRCPACGGRLTWTEHVSEPAAGTFGCGCGRAFPVRDGVMSFVHPEQLRPSDEEFRRKYDDGAPRYDEGVAWLFRSFYENEDTVRASTVDLLRIRPGARILDIGSGTGKDSLHIARRIGPAGELFVLDLSCRMLQVARATLAQEPAHIEYIHANAAYLPFASRSFDAVFHFGGINEFGEVARALAEMTRVTALGGRVVVGDEGVPPWLRETELGKILINANPLYRHEPPLDALPVGAREVNLRWLLGNAFYVIDFRVDEGEPPVDLDLPIPGKGDTLRSRYLVKKRPD